MGKCYKPKRLDPVEELRYYVKFKYKANPVYPGGTCKFDNAILYCQYGLPTHYGNTWTGTTCEQYGHDCSPIEIDVLPFNSTPLDHCAQTTNPNKSFMEHAYYSMATSNTSAPEPQFCVPFVGQTFPFCEYKPVHYSIMQCEEQDMVLA